MRSRSGLMTRYVLDRTQLQPDGVPGCSSYSKNGR